MDKTNASAVISCSTIVHYYNSFVHIDNSIVDKGDKMIHNDFARRQVLIIKATEIDIYQEDHK